MTVVRGAFFGGAVLSITLSPSIITLSPSLFGGVVTGTSTGVPVLPVGPVSALVARETLIALPDLDVLWARNGGAITITGSLTTLTTTKTARLRTFGPLFPLTPLILGIR